jgi:uncharacterized protein YggE
MVSFQLQRFAPAGLVVGVAATAAAVVLAAGSGPVAAAGTSGPEPASVTITGTGQAVGAPDVLRVTLAVSTRGDDVSTAMERTNDRVRRIRAALKADQVADRDVQTVEFNVGSAYSKKNPGYRAAQTLSVTLRDLPKAGRAISHAAAAGGNATRIYGVSYDIEDRARLQKEARDLAFADAKAKAARYAELAGRPLGAVRTVSEGGAGGYEDRYECGGCLAAAAAPAADATSAVPLAAGSRRETTTATVVWELG